MIRVVLVDDQPMIRSGVQEFLSVQPDIEVVGEASNGIEALEVVAQLSPDVVLMDVRMPVLDGVAATKRLRAAYPEIQIVLFTTLDSDGYVQEGVQAGAAGYLLKSANVKAIVEALRMASQGRTLATLPPDPHDNGATMTTDISSPFTSIPSVPSLPILGNLLDIRRDRLGFFLRVSRECGDIGQYHLGPRPLTLLNAPESVAAVLVEQAAIFEKTRIFRTVMGHVLGNGLLTAENAGYMEQRKLVAPAFQHRRIAAYAAIMADYAEQIHQTWADGQEINIAQEMMRLTLRIVGKTLFDVDVLGEADELGSALTQVIRWTDERFTAVLPLPLGIPTPANRRFIQGRNRLDATIFRMITERRRSGVDHGDFLSMLLHAQDEESRQGLTDQQVRDEAMTIFVAGHETTANALTWTWYLLAQHPDVYTRVHEEVTHALGGRTPSIDDLPRLPYTLQVLKESLRLYPPAYAIVRQPTEPVVLGGYRFPAGAILIISPYLLHRRPDAFPDPERFDPDRWTPEHEAKLPRYAYLPFSAGPRVCIGNHFAMMEAHLILATLVQRVTFDLVPGQRVEPVMMVTLRPRIGMTMTVTRKRALP